MPSVSVIVPVYNVEQYLRCCIGSVLAQTFSDFELILVDDGSPDNCGAICDEYAAKDSRIVVIHQKNSGVSCARNTALKVAKGEYVTFCDSDDYYATTWLEDLYSGIGEADIALAQYSSVSDAGNIGKTSRHECGVYSINNTDDRINYVVRYVFGGKHGWEIWTRLFRMEIIQQYHIRFCESCGNFAEDLGFVLEYMLFAKKLISLPALGYYYRVRNGSMMQSSKNQVKLDAMNEISQQYIATIKHYESDRRFKRVIPIFHFLIMCNQYGKLLGTDQYQHLHRYIHTIHRYKEWRMFTKQIFGCYNELVRLVKKGNARRILLLSHYCLHGNWTLFQLESAIVYKWFIEEI